MSTISKLATSQYLTDKHWEYRDPSQVKFIIPHHMASKSTGANCAYYFQHNGLENSANYCIGFDGDISCSVPEDFGAWTSSFWGADKYGITFEVSDTAYGDWTIPARAQEAMIQLMVDIFKRYPSLGGKAIYDPTDEARVVSCKRQGIPITGVKGNILIHNWTSAYATTCPEWHMRQILPLICAEVNKRLSDGTKRTPHEEAQYMLDNNVNGSARKSQARADGFDPDDVQAEIDKMLAKDKTAVWKSLVQWYPDVKKGDTGLTVQILQTELKRMGYYTGDIDGSAGSLTDSAIRALQKNWNIVYKGFTVNGVFNQKCWKQLLT